MANLNSVRSVAIIGAGVSGLTAARLLMQQGVDCTVYERSQQVGGVWSNGYVNFGVQVPKDLYEFPDWPLPDETSDFTPGPAVRNYLERYADHFGLTPHIRLGTTVEAVERRKDDGWSITLRRSDETIRAEFDMVVLAIGLFSNVPDIPDIPGREIFAGNVLHASEVKSDVPLKVRRVAVVGYGKSATDLALEAIDAAKETHLIFRTSHWPVPRKLAGILPFKWGMLNRLASTLIPLYQRPSRLEKVVHSLGKPLVWLWWRIVELLLRVQCRLDTPIEDGATLLPDKPVEFDAFSESVMLPRPDLYCRIRKGEIHAHRTEITRYTPDGITLRNGRELKVDTVVYGTGWRTEYRFLPDALKDDLGFDRDGVYLYRHMLHPAAPGLVFLGQASTVSNILSYSLQARWLADLIAGKHTLPDPQAMMADIEEMKAWKRQSMPHSAARSARLILHLQHYHDELLRDIGADPLRKTGVFAPLKELIAPYEPKDYRTIVSGDWESMEGKPPLAAHANNIIYTPASG